MLLLSFTHSVLPALCDIKDCSIPGFPVLHHLPELSQTHPFLFLHSIFSSIMVFFNDSVFCIRCLIYWSFIFISSNEYSELISIRTDRFDILVVQGTLRSRFKYYGSKVSILQHSAFFVVQLSQPYTTTEKNHSLDHTDLCGQSDLFAS